MNSARARLGAARLYVIVDLEVTKRSPAVLASRIAAAGADVIQLRGVGVPDRKLFGIAREMVRRVRRCSRALVVVNNRADIALAADADGVHLGSNDLEIPQARSILGKKRLIGATTHNAGEARAAARRGADYLSYGPVFKTPIKPRLRAAGLKYLDTMKRIGLPFFAIGGIHAGRIPHLKRHDIDRVCVCRAVIAAKSPAEEVQRIRKALTGGR
jgi:thiamine-phosphate pyrophosphorylase